MQFPNIAAMSKWVNNFFPGAPTGSQDFLQIARQSDGTIFGWIDENGFPKGSLLLTGGFGPVTPLGEIVDFSNITGVLGNIPNGNYFQLFKNGALLNAFTPALTSVFLNNSGVSWQLVIVGEGESAQLAITEVSYSPSYPTSVAIQSPNGNYWAISVSGSNLETTPISPIVTAPIILTDADDVLWEVTIDNTWEFLSISETTVDDSGPDYSIFGPIITLAIPAIFSDVFVAYYSYIG